MKSCKKTISKWQWHEIFGFCFYFHESKQQCRPLIHSWRAIRQCEICWLLFLSWVNSTVHRAQISKLSWKDIDFFPICKSIRIFKWISTWGYIQCGFKTVSDDSKTSGVTLQTLEPALHVRNNVKFEQNLSKEVAKEVNGIIQCFVRNRYGLKIFLPGHFEFYRFKVSYKTPA